VARRRHRFALFARRLQPGGLGNLHLLNGLKRSGAVGGTEFQVRNVGDVALIFFAVEHIDVVVLHRAPPEGRVYFVACSISLVPKLCLGTHCPRNSVSRTASKSWRRRETGVSRTVGSQTGVWEPASWGITYRVSPSYSGNSGVERYRSPRSGSTTTISLPALSGRLATCTATWTAAPPLMPHS